MSEDITNIQMERDFKRMFWGVVGGLVLAASLAALAIADDVGDNEEKIAHLETTQEEIKSDVAEIKSDVSSLNAKVEAGNQAILRELDRVHEALQDLSH